MTSRVPFSDGPGITPTGQESLAEIHPLFEFGEPVVDQLKVGHSLFQLLDTHGLDLTGGGSDATHLPECTPTADPEYNQ